MYLTYLYLCSCGSQNTYLKKKKQYPSQVPFMLYLSAFVPRDFIRAFQRLQVLGIYTLGKPHLKNMKSWINGLVVHPSGHKIAWFVRAAGKGPVVPNQFNNYVIFHVPFQHQFQVFDVMIEYYYVLQNCYHKSLIQVYSTALLSIITMLYITFSCLIYFIIGIL